jgi:hypothetical protein
MPEQAEKAGFSFVKNYFSKITGNEQDSQLLKAFNKKELALFTN